jgi:hypothetical protein
MCGVLEVGDAKEWYTHLKNGSFHEVLAKYLATLLKPDILVKVFGL